MRTLVLESGKWQYKVGKQWANLITPAGKRHNLPCGQLLGVTDWDDGNYGIEPSDVKRYIEANMHTLVADKK